MRTLIIVAALLLPATAAPAQIRSPLDPRPECAAGADKAKGDKVVGAKRLGDLPPATEYKTVYRTDEKGCPKPLVVRRNIGPTPRAR